MAVKRITSGVASLSGTVQVPAEVRISDKWVEWTTMRSEKGRVLDSYLSFGRHLTEVDGPACMRSLVRLADRPDVAIADHVRRFGGLLLGASGQLLEGPLFLPTLYERSGKQVWEWDGLDENLPPDSIWSDQQVRRWYREPLQAWRGWSRLLRSLIAISKDLRQRREDNLARIPVRDLPELESSPMEPGRIHNELISQLAAKDVLTVEQQWSAFRSVVNMELLLPTAFSDRFRIQLGGRAGAPHLTLSQDDEYLLGCYPLIIASLLVVIVSIDSHNHCCRCGLPYPVDRVRKNGVCPECKREANAEAARASRQRRKTVQPGIQVTA